MVAAGAILGSVLAAPTQGTAWQNEKCKRYTKAWQQLLARRGSTGLGQPFLKAHDAFLASGCLEGRNVCPRSPAELEVANAMIIQSMNGGMASTFAPFACKG